MVSDSARFLKPVDVAETLNVSQSQALALVRSGDLRAIKVGGRGQWRIERIELDRYIETAYAKTRQSLAHENFNDPDEGDSSADPAPR